MLGSPGPSAFAQVTPAQRRQAATSYDEGRVYFRSGEFAEAAQAFMAAYRLAPSHNALVQAVRSYLRAEQLDRAGTLGLYLATEYGGVEVAAATAEEAINAAAEHYHRVDVVCGDGSEPCELALEGRCHRLRAQGHELEELIVAGPDGRGQALGRHLPYSALGSPARAAPRSAARSGSAASERSWTSLCDRPTTPATLVTTEIPRIDAPSAAARSAS